MFSIVTFPVIKACALISAQSSNLGFKWAISGFCKNAFLLSGLNKPEVFRLFSTTDEISEPTFSIFSSLLEFFFELSSWNSGETAIGKGSKYLLLYQFLLKNLLSLLKTKILKGLS